MRLIGKVEISLVLNTLFVDIQDVKAFEKLGWQLGSISSTAEDSFGEIFWCGLGKPKYPKGFEPIR